MSVPMPDRIKSRFRESDVELIYGLAEGLPFKEIADRAGVGVSELQVSNRVFWLRHSVFKARTNAQLVALSYHYGILRSPTSYDNQASTG